MHPKYSCCWIVAVVVALNSLQTSHSFSNHQRVRATRGGISAFSSSSLPVSTQLVDRRRHHHHPCQPSTSRSAITVVVPAASAAASSSDAASAAGGSHCSSSSRCRMMSQLPSSSRLLLPNKIDYSPKLPSLQQNHPSSRSRRMHYTRMQSSIPVEWREIPRWRRPTLFRWTHCENFHTHKQQEPLVVDEDSVNVANTSTMADPTSTTTTATNTRSTLSQWKRTITEQPFTVLHGLRRAQRKRQLRRYMQSRAVAVKESTVMRTETVASAADAATVMSTTTTTTTTTATTKSGLSKMDVALFMTYFCNIAVVTLTVVTVPALAAEHLSLVGVGVTATTTTTTTCANHAHAASAFVASVAGMAPLGGAVGKIINGFVCQRLGGRTASWTYLLGLAVVSGMLSCTQGLASIGALLMGLEFLSSIQWTSVCHILDSHYRSKPQLMARGIALLSLSSTLGALAAKTVGAGLLQATNWRTVCRLGSLAALVGAGAMYLGVARDEQKSSNMGQESDALGSTQPKVSTAAPPLKRSPLSILKSIVGNRIFWMVGMAHSLGYLARGNDRLLGAFLQEATFLPSHIAAGLTSSVTIGFVGGLFQGRIFSKMDSVKKKMKMIKQNYIVSLVSILGLALCGITGIGNFLGSSNSLLAALITVFAGIMASTVSFQFYQFPNLVSSNVFPDNSAVSLSLLDAAGFFFTAQVLAANSRILGSFGWSASWTFMALIFGIGGTIMTRAIQPVLLQARRTQQQHEGER